MASTDARPLAIKNTAYRVTFPLLDADGDLVTGATSPDSEVSKDGGTFADCTNEATEIATTSGMYYLDLTSTEMNADCVAVIVKSGTAKTTPLVFYPQELGDVKVDVQSAAGVAWASGAITRASLAADTGLGPLHTGTAQAGDATHITFNAGASSADNFYNTQMILLMAGTGAGQWAIVDDYVGATRVALVDRTWVTNPDNTTVFVTFPAPTSPADIAALVWAATARTLTAGTNIVLAKGTGVTGFNDLSAAQVNAEVDTALTDIHLDHLLAATYDPASKPGAADALLNELVENDAGVSRYSANALEQAPTGGSAPTVSEIADAVLDEAMAGHTTAGTVGKALADTLADTNELQADWANAGRLDTILDARASQTSVDDLPTNAELATALGTADDAVLAQVALVKAKTDSLIFTVAGSVDANIQRVNDVLLVGDASSIPWGPA